jgi:methionyl-tRNA synthetase
VRNAAVQADLAIERMAPHEAVAAIWTIVEELNGYITLEEPWALAKDPATAGRLDSVLATAAEGLRALAVLLSPVVPKSTATLWAALGAEAALGPLADQRIRAAGDWGLLPAGTQVSAVAPLFPRIDPDVLNG